MTKPPKSEGRAAMLKRLREEHADSVAHTQERLKENNQIRKAILQSLQEKSKTVPEIAAEVSMPTPQVLWHLTAYKKYDIVVEDGMDGDYVLYKKVEKVD